MKFRKPTGIAGWVRWTITEKRIVYLVVCTLCVAGIVSLFQMNKDEFPTFQIKQGLVAGVYPGATSAEVEEQLTKPLEETLFSYKEVDRGTVKSVTKDGICYIYVDLNCRQSQKDEVWSKIKLGLQARKLTLPTGVLAVAVLDDFSAVSSMLISMESSDKSYSELEDYADELCTELRKIPQLAKVSVVGSQEEEIAVELDMEKISSYGIDPATLLLGYSTATLSLPSGSFKTDYTNSPIHVLGSVNNEREVSEKIVYSDPVGNVVRLKDVATISRRVKSPDNFVSYNGNSCLVLNVEMRPDNNIVAFGDDVDKVLEKYSLTLPDSVSMSRISDQPKVVARSVYSFLRDLLISMLVVIFVMIMMFPLRSALIASSGVPVCTAVAIAVMYFAKIDLNTVTLAALIVVLGMIVDDSIITMDGYMDKLSKGYDRIDAACASAKELFMPTFIATAAICTMFFPMTFIIKGYLGDFVKMFPWVITIALMMSLFYAVSMVPSLEVKYIRPQSPNDKKNFIARGQDRFFDFIQRVYDKAQAVAFSFPLITILGGVLAVALGLLMFFHTNIQMMPMAARDYFVIEMELENGQSIDRTKSFADSLTTILLEDKRVESVTAFVGTGAPRFAATYTPKLPSPSFTQLLVNTTSPKATESILKEYESRYEHIFPGAIIRFKQMDYQAVDAQIVVDIKGDRRADLLATAEKIKAYMSSMDSELKWVHSNCDNYQSSVNISLNPDEASRLGVNKSILALSLAGTFNGQTISTLWEGGHQIPVNLYSAGINDSMPYETISNQMVATSVPGVSVPLRQVAYVSPDWTLAELTRLAGIDAVTVYADMKYGESQPAAMKKIQKYINEEVEPGLPDGVSVEYGGLSSMNKSVIPQIMWSFIAAVMVLFVFLLFHFKKTSLAALALILSSLCLFGAFFGLWVFGLDFSITAVLGLVSLVGIIVRNGILMFDYAEEQRFKHGVDVKTASMEAGKRRMRPIFLTSCTTALGVLPMIISGDNLWMPMGVVICFGTMLSIFLIVLVMPVSYWQLFRRASTVPPESLPGGSLPASGSASHPASGSALLLLLLLVLPAQPLSAQGKSSAQPLSSQGGPSAQSRAVAQQGRSTSPQAAVQQDSSDQVPPAVHSLSLDDCLKMASENNPYVRNAHLDVLAAKAQKQEALAEYFPKVSAMAVGFHALHPMVSLGVNDILGHSDAANNIKAQIEQIAPLYGLPTTFDALQYGYGATLNVTQPIFAGGRIVNGNRLARLGVEAAQLQEKIQQKETASDIEAKYWLVVSLEEKAITLNRAQEMLDTLTKDMESATAAGLLPPSDRLQLQLKQKELRSKYISLKGGTALARMDLMNAIGLEYSLLDTLLLTDRLEDLKAPSDYYVPEEELASNTEESRLLSLQVEAKTTQKRMVVGETLPTVGVGAMYGYSKYLGDGGTNGTVYAMVKIPISDWGKNGRKIERYEYQRQKAENERDYLDAQLVLRARQRWIALQTAWEQLGVADETVYVAREEVARLGASYRAGLIPLSELMQSETALRQCEDARVDACITYKQALTEYLK